MDKGELKERVFDFTRRHELLPRGETVLVGVSGGPDSVCLLHILVTLRERLGIELHLVHLNHMLRGVESDADAEYVSQLATELGLAVTIERRDVRAFQTRHHLSLEEAAREVRYRFFSRVAQKVGARRLAVGHTQDDQVETILMQLVRGVGTHGLRGMSPITTRKWAQDAPPLTVVRPLLQVTREETEKYCRLSGSAVRSDSSNISPSHLRNRIRLEIMPLLRGCNRGIERPLIRASDIAASDIAFIDEQVRQVWDEVVEERERALVLNKAKIASLHPSLQGHLFRAVLERMLGSLKDVEWRHIESLSGALSLPPGKMLSLPHGLKLCVGYGELLLAQDPLALCPFPPMEGEHKLKVPGETIIPGWRVRTRVIPPPAVTGRGLEAHLDFALAGGELMVRRCREGDRFHPLGMERPKKLSRFMVDAKIPQGWRGRVPLVSNPKHIIWVVGWRIDDRVKVTPNTEKALHLKFERVP